MPSGIHHSAVALFTVNPGLAPDPGPDRRVPGGGGEGAAEDRISIGQPTPSSAEVHAILVRCAAAVARFAPVGQAYDTRAKGVKGGVPIAMMYEMEGILRALRDDYAAGYLQTVQELIHADVFADFLAMAHELLTKKYKDPAAVLTGSVLEEHLRKLAVAAGVGVLIGGKPEEGRHHQCRPGQSRHLQQAGTEAGNGLAGPPQQSCARALRRDDEAQVEGLIRDVSAFMVRHPA